MISYDEYSKIRNNKGMRDADIVKITGIPKSTFSDWKNGRSYPKLAKLEKIASALNVSIDRLSTGKDTEKESISGQKYYFDDATAEKAQQLFDNPGMRILFDAAQDSKPEDLQMAADLLERLKGTNPDG